MHNNELYHHGVKGQKWGVENGPPYPLVSGMSERKARSRAKKDAKEYARAKMFYGEGAGNRRKLIKNIVAERSKDPTYKQAFEDALSRQDMEKAAKRAKSERHILDIPKIVGTTVAVSATVATIAHKTGADKIVANAVKTKISDIHSRVNLDKARRWLNKSVVVV